MYLAFVVGTLSWLSPAALALALSGTWRSLSAGRLAIAVAGSFLFFHAVVAVLYGRFHHGLTFLLLTVALTSLLTYAAMRALGHASDTIREDLFRVSLAEFADRLRRSSHGQADLELGKRSRRAAREEQAQLALKSWPIAGYQPPSISS